MPSYMTHHLFAKSLEHMIPPEGRTCFLYGTQGADLLFFSRALTVFRWDSLAKYGVALHQSKSKPSIEFMADYLKHNYDPLLEGYIKGYLCHYALDRAIHPYVYALIPKLKEATGRPDTWCHLKIETNMDVIMLRYYTGLRVSEYDCRRMFARDNLSEGAVASFYHNLFITIFGKMILPEQIIECFKQRRLAVRLLYSPRRVKYNMLRFILSPIRPASTLLQLSHPNVADDTFDYTNSSCSRWINPFTKEVSYDSIFDLADKAIIDAQKMWGMLDNNDFSEMNWLDFDGRQYCYLEYPKKRRHVRVRFRRKNRKR